jgi:hypothetical protein
MTMSTPDRDPPEVYSKEREEMRRKDDGELLKIRSTGRDYQKHLAEEELEDRRYARNVLPDRRRAWAALVLSIIAIIISIIALFV